VLHQAVVNKDPYLGIQGISGVALGATHYGRTGAGEFLVVPGAEATLASVAELTRHGNELTFHTNGTLTITNANGLVVRGTRNRDNIYEITRKDYTSLQAAMTKAYPARVTAKSTAATRADRGATTLTNLYTPEQQARAAKVMQLHEACSHPSDTTLTLALNNGLLIGTPLTARDVLNARDIYGPCPACIAGKITKPTFTASTNEPAYRTGQTIHVDILGLHEASIGGYLHYLFCVDEFSSFKTLIPVRTKQTTDLLIGFTDLKAQYATYKHNIQKIQCDSESSLASCTTGLGLQGISLATVPPYQHAQRVERHVRTVNDRVWQT
jgi:hypothetical protein